MSAIMTLGILSGIITGLLLLGFLGVVAWAYSARRNADFAQAARLPLDEREEPLP
jgi:cytochrome c oxidase cbb3-type subunit IV